MYQRLGYCTPKTLVKIYICNGKKLKISRNSLKFAAKFNKKTFFLSLHQSAGLVFYFQIKQVFSYKNNFEHRFGANLKNPFFVIFFCKFLAFFSFFNFLLWETLKMHILTSALGSQHPNTGQNIQQIIKYKFQMS